LIEELLEMSQVTLDVQHDIEMEYYQPRQFLIDTNLYIIFQP